MSEIRIDWKVVEEHRKQPLTEEELAQIRIFQERYGISDEAWNQNIPPRKQIPVRPTNKNNKT